MGQECGKLALNCSFSAFLIFSFYFFYPRALTIRMLACACVAQKR
jgi:hypothetical protein